MQSAIRPRLINQINRLVWQIALIDIFRTHVYCIRDDTLPVSDAMIFFIVLFESLQNACGIFDVGFFDIYILKASHKALALLEMLLVFLIGRRTDKSDIPCCQIGL